MYTASLKVADRWEKVEISQDAAELFKWLYVNDGKEAVVCETAGRSKTFYAGDDATLAAYRKSGKSAGTFDDLGRKLLI